MTRALFLALFLIAAPAQAATPLVQQASVNLGGGPQSVSVAYTSPVTAGNLLVVGVSVLASGQMALVTDSMGNAWTRAITFRPQTEDGPVENAIFYTVAKASGATTVTLTAYAITLTAFLYEYATGGAEVAVSGTAQALGSVGHPPFPTIDPGAIAAHAGDLLISLAWYDVQWGQPFPLAAGSGFTKRTERDSGDGAGLRYLTMQDRLAAAGGSTMAWGGRGGVWNAIGAAFTLGAAPPPVIPPAVPTIIINRNGSPLSIIVDGVSVP